MSPPKNTKILYLNGFCNIYVCDSKATQHSNFPFFAPLALKLENFLFRNIRHLDRGFIFFESAFTSQGRGGGAWSSPGNTGKAKIALERHSLGLFPLVSFLALNAAFYEAQWAKIPKKFNLGKSHCLPQAFEISAERSGLERACVAE